jgi:hypothetical protein
LSLADDQGGVWKVKDAQGSYVSPADGRLAWLKPDHSVRLVKPATASGEWTFKPGAAITANGVTYTITLLTANPDGSVTAKLGAGGVVPPVCAGCGKGTGSGASGLCTSCYVAAAGPPREKCASCGTALHPGQLRGSRCRTCETKYQKGLAEKKARASLPVVKQDDPIKATKYAKLCLDKAGKPYFAGVGYGQYYTESEAVCAKGKTHQVPDPGCTCGFWVGTRKESKLSEWNARQVALEVELAGTVLECAPDGTPDTDDPWGYRAQWQRVLSVSLPAQCGMGVIEGSYSSYYDPLPVRCDGPPLFLCADGTSEVLLLTACQAHVKPKQAIKKPVSFLREFLQTEVRPGTVSDMAEPKDLPPVSHPDVEQLRKDWAATVKDITGKLVKLENLPLPVLVAPVGTKRKVDVNGITYTLVGTATGWMIDRVDSPELDALKVRALEIQKLYVQRKISRKDIESLAIYVNLT